MISPEVAAYSSIVDTVPLPTRSGEIVSRFGRNHIIFADGDKAVYCYKVVSGIVRLVTLMADGRRNIASFKRAGTIFGVDQLSEYTYSAEAVTDVVAVQYPRGQFGQKGNQGSDASLLPMKDLLGELQDARQHMVTLGCRSARERVALFLYSLACQSNTRDGGRIALLMGREDVADHLGLTVETVCRNLRSLKAAGVIDIPTRQDVIIVSRISLRTIARAES